MTNATSLPYIVYPETDGLPMSESDVTRDYLLYCFGKLFSESARGICFWEFVYLHRSPHK